MLSGPEKFNSKLATTWAFVASNVGLTAKAVALVLPHDDLPLVTRVLMNLPHLAIGGFAAFTGFVLAGRWAPTTQPGR